MSPDAKGANNKMSSIEQPPKSEDITTSTTKETEINAKNPNKKRNSLIAAGVGVATLAATTFGGIVAANNNREAQQLNPESIAEEQAQVGNGNDIIENPSIDVPAETSPPIEAPATPEQDVVSANTLTDDQIFELLVGCPDVPQFYPNASELIRKIDEPEAQAIYKTFKEQSPKAAEDWLLLTLTALNKK